MGLLVRSTLLNRRGADVQVVKAFDGSSKEHRARKAGNLIAGKRKGWEISCFGDWGESLFDYGCHHGGDVEAIEKIGHKSAGWDPVHAPEISKQETM